ncbi:ankyrin repeat-containing domain protein [Bisporella sp. PMI_857]|nr:ankyrin repeat-containing domain protein [Bisporella sp. PMI_857]
MAILEGQSRFVDTILERSPHLSINLKDKDGNTPLLLAVQKNVDVVIESLLRCEANAELRNKKGETALTKAVTKAVAFSIRRKVESAWTTLLKTPDRLNINAGGGAFPTALHIATRSGELGVLKQLVMEYGADVNAQGGLYNTALQAAAVSGYDDLVEFLLENGADASISGGLFANALSAAIWFGDFAIVPMLYEKGADVNARDEQGRTAVHISAWRGSVENIEWLMARSGDLSLKDYQGRTVLHHAAMGGTLEMVEMIMQDRRLELSNLEDVDGWTALHWACRSAKNGNVIRFLVEAGADSSKKAKHGWTPENIAIFHNASDLLPLLSANELAGGKMSNETEHGGISRSTELPKKDKWRVSEIAYGYVCDGCQQHPIYGRRWKCLVCEDFNFCFKCYWGKGITHAEHAFEGNGADSGTVLELVSDSN